ncbi:hypothetical protein Halru_1818 [Halovivax ruber XH-70]|uniref:Acyl-CoA synthetase (AMP-forming)/AMP-acid ligase II n=1 Tax=Halovivax ruber (strain DSM 18193 / JCM 13892 / XH-70) TaxID=797302 RepID=L0IEN1_HALRX|nr:hypothetical protein [Halovivax ruber]AGB16417.1 hypothetical protein Halru_1818 [Halovivax ruber XH-70]
METVADYLTRDRRGDRPALVDSTGRTYDAHWVCTSAWKAGNFLRHTGVRRGVTVGVVGDGPLAVLSFLGTALLSGRTWFDPPSTAIDAASSAASDAESHTQSDAESLRTIVAPATQLEGVEAGPSTQLVCYGGEPPAPAVHHLDAGLWSENPSFPPVDIDPETPLLAVDDGDGTRCGSVSHATALAEARRIAEAFDIEAGTRVVVDRAFDDPRTVVAGVLAPLVADGVTVLTGGTGGRTQSQTPEASLDDGEDGAESTEPEGALFVTDADATSVPERRLPLSAVELDVS